MNGRLGSAESAGGAGSATGSGGMLTKIKAARVLMRAGIPMVICEGSRANALVDIVEGDQVGTMFVSGGSRKALQAKKLWIALGDKSRGVLVIDDGACRALRENGGSLLPVGVRQVKGTFGRGAIVNIRDLHDRLVGRGFSRYSSDEIGLAAGKHSDEIAQMVSISSLAGVDVVHRDEMIVF